MVKKDKAIRLKFTLGLMTEVQARRLGLYFVCYSVKLVAKKEGVSEPAIVYSLRGGIKRAKSRIDKMAEPSRCRNL